MKLFQQRDNYDCLPACIATLLQLSNEEFEAMPRFFTPSEDSPPGVGDPTSISSWGSVAEYLLWEHNKHPALIASEYRSLSFQMTLQLHARALHDAPFIAISHSARSELGGNKHAVLCWWDTRPRPENSVGWIYDPFDGKLFSWDRADEVLVGGDVTSFWFCFLVDHFPGY